MASRNYIGNLPYAATDQQLAQHFEAYDELTEARVVTNRNSGQRKGSGFVQMIDNATAHTAIGALDGTLMESRSIRVNGAQARLDTGGRGDRRPRHDTGYRDRPGNLLAWHCPRLCPRAVLDILMNAGWWSFGLLEIARALPVPGCMLRVM